jgi:hypothetical protein
VLVIWRSRDDLSPDCGPGEEHPRRYVHGYHLLVFSHGLPTKLAAAVVGSQPIFAAGFACAATLQPAPQYRRRILEP